MNEQTLPGITPQNKRLEIRKRLEIAKTDSAKAERDMKKAALALADIVAERLAAMESTPANVSTVCLAYLGARNAMLEADAEIGNAASALREIDNGENTDD